MQVTRRENTPRTTHRQIWGIAAGAHCQRTKPLTEHPKDTNCPRLFFLERKPFIGCDVVRDAAHVLVLRPAGRGTDSRRRDGAARVPQARARVPPRQEPLERRDGAVPARRGGVPHPEQPDDEARLRHVRRRLPRRDHRHAH